LATGAEQCRQHLLDMRAEPGTIAARDFPTDGRAERCWLLWSSTPTIRRTPQIVACDGREPAKVSEISGLGPSTREEIRMLNRWVRTMTGTVGRGGPRLGQIVKNCSSRFAPRPHSPAPPPSTLFGRARIGRRERPSATPDSRAGSAAPPRPRLFRKDHLVLVLLAHVNTAWRNALHLVQPGTILRWHRDLFILFWRHRFRRTQRSRGLGARRSSS
jgi:hypothetical protein